MADTTVAVLEARLEGCQRAEVECKAQNHEQHEAFYARISGLELEMARVGVRLGYWAAGGGIVGGAIVSVVVAFVVWRMKN